MRPLVFFRLELVGSGSGDDIKNEFRDAIGTSG